MRIVRAQLAPYRLALRAPLATAHGAIEARSGWLLALTTDTGAVGFGESAPLLGFGLETAQQTQAALRAAAERLVGAPLGEGPGADARTPVEAVLERAFDALPQRPAARAAVDCALCDLAAQASGISLAQWLAESSGRAPRATLPVNAVLAPTAREAACEALAAARAQGFRTFKAKVGGRPLDEDLARIAALRARLRPGERLRLDANGGWSEAQAARALDAIGPDRIEYVEQPLAPGDVDALARLARRGVPIAADESAASLDAVHALLARAAAHVIILKPAAVGGLHASLRIIAAAAEHGVDVVVTSLIDSAVGVAMASALAAALPTPADGAPRAHGLATSGLLAADVATPPAIEAGELRVPTAPGLGVAPTLPLAAAIGAGPGCEVALGAGAVGCPA